MMKKEQILKAQERNRNGLIAKRLRGEAERGDWRISLADSLVKTKYKVVLHGSSRNPIPPV